MFRWYLFRNITSDQPDFTNMSNLSEKCQRRHQASFALRDVKSRGLRLLHFVLFNKKGEAVEVGEGCVSVGGRQTVRVWGNENIYFPSSPVRGVLGNKRAGHHNLKTVKIREIVWK